MNRKLYTFILSVMVMMQVTAANGQCPAGRYINEIFSSYTLDSVVYSTPFGQKMDIYQPAGDTLSARPVIILAHGGSFVAGNREDDPTVDSLCVRFARRGYVTVSIDYRLGDALLMALDSSDAVTEVIQAISDGKAAIRYFVQDRATTNTYKVDTNNIFIGGNSAGAVLYMHVGYLENIAACPPDIAAAMATNGGFEGNSGNAGYTTKSKAVIDLAGGLNSPSFIVPGGKPSVNAQGTADDVVPYTCGLAVGGEIKVTLCGLGSLEPVYDSNRIYHMSLLFPGAGHVPWATDPVEFNSVDSIVTVFLYNLVCTGVTSVNTVATNAGVLLYPNPTSDLLNIKSGQTLQDMVIYDETGRIMMQETGINREDYEINTSRFHKGIYFIKLRFSDDNYAPLMRSFIVN